jgi:hypothetical protein
MTLFPYYILEYCHSSNIQFKNGWTRFAACKEDKKNVCKLSVTQPEGKRIGFIQPEVGYCWHDNQPLESTK